MSDNNKEIIIIFQEESFRVDTQITSNKAFFFDEKLYKELKANPYKSLFYFGFVNKKSEMSLSTLFIHSIAVKFIHQITKDPDIEITRSPGAIPTELLMEILHSVPYVIGIEYINTTWIKKIWNKLSEAFEIELADYSGSIADFIKQQDAGLGIAGRVFFHLVENKSEDYPFAFLATYSTTASNDKKALHMPLKNALLEFKNQNDLLLQLLSTVSKAADRSKFISELVESGELFSPLKFTSDEAYIFLKELSIYEECGILCRIPDWWRKKTNSVKLSVSVGDKAPAGVGMDAILSFNPSLFFGDEQITKEEIEQLLTETSGLSFIKGKWVEVDHDKLKAALQAYEKAYELSQNGDLSLAEAMRAQMNIQAALNIDEKEAIVEVSNGQWLSSIRDRLLNPMEIEQLSLSDGFKATLRTYQQTGFDWLHFMKELRFGALLADDMGLGKTVQILALLEYLREHQKVKTLLILPASLIGNWQKETERFAPLLKYKIIHGSVKESICLESLEEADLYITTYGMAVRLEELKNIVWDLVILDEAQAIKNPNTKQTKAIKQLQAGTKIAMTGTPVENRLTDLWSIFDFLNKGLLGTAKEFSELVKQLKDKDDYSKLRSVISPFILRRLKTDKSIISDLPDKIEVKAYTTLTKKQIVLYKALVNELSKSLEGADGISRKGLVLASIMKLKQICNHPDQYLGQMEFAPAGSGKFEKLREICEIIYEKRERVLIFTQFKEMVKPIADYLESVFDRKGLILHGGTSVNKRSELVEQFCGDEYIPFMVLSLKAGGVGLNLTSANHVIHFDRWWNPAIENQATDRAFRIGQQKNVMVHKFVTSGTIEDKIDIMISEKQKIAGEIIAKSGENWITELGNDELLSMLELGRGDAYVGIP